jgi:hypothetical protein
MKVENLEVTVIQEVQTGTSAAGKEWKKMIFVGKTKEEYNNTFAFEIFGAEKIEKFNKYTKVGSEIDVDFNIKCNEWKGKYYTSLDYWKSFKSGETTDDFIDPEPEDDIPF